MGAPARVRWTALGQHGAIADWAGDGTGVAKMFNENHPGGPAVLVEFDRAPDDNRPRLQAWVSPNDLVQIEEETAS